MACAELPVGRRLRHAHARHRVAPVQVEGDGTAYCDRADQLGSIRALTDGTGAVVNSDQYDAYGNRTSSRETVANPFG